MFTEFVTEIGLRNLDLEEGGTLDTNYLATLKANLHVGQKKGCKLNSPFERRQEDRIKSGLIPNEYWALTEIERRNFHLKNCLNMQRKLTHTASDLMNDRGATMLLACTDGENIDVAYLGDSMAFFLVEEENQIVDCELLNPFFHQASHPEEKKRIISAGGFVEFSFNAERLNNTLMLSRALGNNRFALNESNPILSREATVCTKKIVLTDKQRGFLLVTSDGFPCSADAMKRVFNQYSNYALPLKLGKIINQVTPLGRTTDDTSIACLELTKGMAPTFLAIYDGHGGHQISELAMQLSVSVFSATLTEILNPGAAADKGPGGNNLTPSSQEIDATQPLPESPELTSYAESVKPDESERDKVSLLQLKRKSIFDEINDSDSQKLSRSRVEKGDAEEDVSKSRPITLD